VANGGYIDIQRATGLPLDLIVVAGGRSLAWVTIEGAMAMFTIAPESPGIPSVSAPQNEPAHPVSGMIDATETLYRFTVEEYEQIAGLLDDDRVELIDGYLVKKMTKRPSHVIGCARVLAAVANILPAGWHARPGEPVRVGHRTEPELDVSLARGTADDYAIAHPGPADVALVVEVADTTLTKDRRRRKTYGPAGIPIYWIVDLNGRKVEVYTNPGPDGYASRTDYLPGMNLPLVVDGAIVGQIAVSDILC
jgi:Uma2 family endonuclease